MYKLLSNILFIFAGIRMKKFLILIVAAFYFGISTGATVHFHYCMGELIEWGLDHEGSQKCGNCGMKKSESKDCCKDQQQQLKIDQSQKAADTSFQFKAASVAIALPAYQEINLNIQALKQEGRPLSHAPPRTSSTPVFIRLCTYRI